MDSSGAFTTGTSPALGGAFRSRELVVLATAVVVGLLWAGKVLFVTLFFALFLSFALHPFVELLEKIRVPRGLAAFVVILLLCALVTFFIVNALDQAQAFSRDWPDYERKIQALTARARGIFSRIEEGTRRLLSEGERTGVRAVRLEEGMLDSVARVVLQVRTAFSLALYTAAVPMLAFFMLKDREKYAGAITRILRRKGGRAASDFAVNVAHVLSGYVLGELFVVLITACITTAGLLILHVPYSYVLGPLAGLCVLLPYVGVILSTAPAVFVAFLGTDEPFLALKVVLFY